MLEDLERELGLGLRCYRMEPAGLGCLWRPGPVWRAAEVPETDGRATPEQFGA